MYCEQTEIDLYYTLCTHYSGVSYNEVHLFDCYQLRDLCKSTLFYGVLRRIGAVTEYPGMNDFVTISLILYLFMMTQEHCSIDSYYVIHDDAAT